LAEKEIVPELLQNNFTVSKVTEIAVRLLQDEDYRATMISRLKSTRTKLGEAGAYDKAGQCIENVLSKEPTV
jgi:lipid A disaccharide synthetase